jgi:large subunit ribosomal protein L29
MAETKLKIAEIREMESPALIELIEAKREELFKLRLEWVTGSLEDPNQVRAVRKDLARMLTVIRERELAAALVGREHNA